MDVVSALCRAGSGCLKSQLTGGLRIIERRTSVNRISIFVAKLFLAQASRDSRRSGAAAQRRSGAAAQQTFS
jgi:hypothetical protein